MPNCNLFQYIDNYSMTSEHFRNYYRDKINNDRNENNADNYKIDKNKTAASISFKYKTKTKESTPLMAIYQTNKLWYH